MASDTANVDLDGEPKNGPGESWVSRAGFWLFFAMVLVSPLPDGSTNPRWVVLWGGVAAAAALLLGGKSISRGTLAVMAGVLITIGAFCVVAYLQSLSPGPLPAAIWGEASDLLGEQIAPMAAVVRNAPLQDIGRPVLGALVFLGALLVAQNRRRCTQLAYAVLGMACLGSFISLVTMALGGSGILTVFFISKNTTATYLGSMTLLGLSLVGVPLIAAVRKGESLASAMQTYRTKEVFFLVGCTIIFLIFLPLTQSRAGILISVALFLLAGAYLTLRLSNNQLVPVVMLLSLFGLVFALTGEVWRARQVRFGFGDLGRLDVYSAMLGEVVKHPLLGKGLGTFADAFPAIRPPQLGVLGFWSIGHSTPLQLLYEGGVPLALVVFALFGACGIILLRGLFRRSHDPFVLAGLLVGVQGTAHSTVDFSLQMPGYAILFMAITGMGVGRALLPMRVRLSRMKGEHRTSTREEAAAPLVAARSSSEGSATGQPSASA